MSANTPKDGSRSKNQNRNRKPMSVEEQRSHTMSYILRHGAQKEKLDIRPDGYVRVKDLLAVPKMKGMGLAQLQEIVAKDEKKRYSFKTELNPAGGGDVLWIRANQGHSMKDIKLDLQEITSADEIPMAVHGTTEAKWRLIKDKGLSRMGRHHVHLAQGVPGDNVLSGMRKSAEILIFLDVRAALAAGLKFYLSENGVVLTEGDAQGFIPPRFFKRVERAADGSAVEGFDGTRDEGGQVVTTLEKPVVQQMGELAI